MFWNREYSFYLIVWTITLFCPSHKTGFDNPGLKFWTFAELSNPMRLSVFFRMSLEKTSFWVLTFKEMLVTRSISHAMDLFHRRPQFGGICHWEPFWQTRPHSGSRLRLFCIFLELSVLLTPVDLWYLSSFPRYWHPDFLWHAEEEELHILVAG